MSTTQSETPRVDREFATTPSPLLCLQQFAQLARTLERECRQWEFVAKSFHDYIANPCQKGCRKRFDDAMRLHDVLGEAQDAAGYDPYLEHHQRVRDAEKALAAKSAECGQWKQCAQDLIEAYEDNDEDALKAAYNNYFKIEEAINPTAKMSDHELELDASRDEKQALHRQLAVLQSQLAAKDGEIKMFELDVMKCRASAMSTKDPSEIVCELVGELEVARQELRKAGLSVGSSHDELRGGIWRLAGKRDEALAREAQIRAALEKARDEIYRLSEVTDKLLNHCQIAECSECGEIACPHHDPLHLHHDGCPSCEDIESHPTLAALNTAKAALSSGPSTPDKTL